jgi:hypothetical protein
LDIFHKVRQLVPLMDNKISDLIILKPKLKILKEILFNINNVIRLVKEAFMVFYTLQYWLI